VSSSEASPLVHMFSTPELKSSARFVRVRARNVGRIPPGNPAAGSKAWLFVDELLVNPETMALSADQ